MSPRTTEPESLDTAGPRGQATFELSSHYAPRAQSTHSSWEAWWVPNASGHQFSKCWHLLGQCSETNLASCSFLQASGLAGVEAHPALWPSTFETKGWKQARAAPPGPISSAKLAPASYADLANPLLGRASRFDFALPCARFEAATLPELLGGDLRAKCRLHKVHAANIQTAAHQSSENRINVAVLKRQQRIPLHSHQEDVQPPAAGR